MPEGRDQRGAMGGGGRLHQVTLPRTMRPPSLTGTSRFSSMDFWVSAVCTSHTVIGFCFMKWGGGFPVVGVCVQEAAGTRDLSVRFRKQKV